MLRSLAREFKLNSCNDFLLKRTRLFSTRAGGGHGRLEGKVALITGSASGLGKATTHEFIRQGGHVILADTDSVLGQQVAKELGPAAHFVHCDVSVVSQIAEAVETTVARHGKLDIMYNNAGITGPAFPPSVADLDLEEFDRVIRVNVRGAVAGMKHAARAGAGSILCTSSISGVLGGLGPHPYAISKFTIPGLVKSVSVSAFCLNECIGILAEGLHTNKVGGERGVPKWDASELHIAGSDSDGDVGEGNRAVYPGATREQVIEIVNGVGVGELKGAKCEEKDVAQAAVYLASDEAKYVTGHNLVVDGGFTCFKTLSFPPPDQFV